MRYRLAVLTAGAAAAWLAFAEAPLAQSSKPEQPPVSEAVAARSTAPALTLTSPPNPAPDRTYDKLDDALIAADIDYIVQEARRAIDRGETSPIWFNAVFADDLAAGDLAAARATIAAAPGGLNGPLGDLFEPFLLAAEGRVDRGVERVDAGGDNLPAPLPEVQRALVFESAGRLDEAAAVYALMAERLDLAPPGEDEPQTQEEFERALSATRVAHAVYRAALVHHRLGRAEDARRYYGIVAQFAPRSADVEFNLARLGAGEPPFEAPLTPASAAGRWLIFLSEFVTQAESLAAILSQRDPPQGLISSTGAAMLQLGILLAPDANDWRLYAAQQVLSAGGAGGAERIINLLPADSVFAADAEIVRASIALERRDDAAATAAAERALALGGDRWSIVASVGDVYRTVGQAERAIPAFSRALEMVSDAKERADVLGYRAYAHRFAGDVASAAADMRAALAADQSVDTRLLYVSILMDDPDGWRDGIAVARSLLAEQPDSVARLNALGYALIQRPEGLEEGYRLLWRGFNYGQTDFAVVDSLGWAYYHYGHFDQARALIERANDLSAADPNPEILDHLGDVYWRLNRRDEARAVWRQALEARPDAIRRRALERKLERGLTEAAPRRRALPEVSLPDGPSRREEL